MYRLSILLCVAISLALSAGCGEQKAEIHGPESYSKDGLAFEHPGNWRVTEDTREAEARYLFVESPGDAIVIIQILEGKDALTIEELARAFSKSATEETPIGTLGSSTFSSVTESGGYEVLTERFTISLLGTSLPHTRTIRRRPYGDAVCVLIEQVADEDRSKVESGFEQIALTLQYDGS